MISMNQKLQIEIDVPKKPSLIQTLQIERGLLKSNFDSDTTHKNLQNNSDSHTTNRDTCLQKQF